ncbi:MAG: hypothetical protein JKY81_02300 [Colwellia sp.]|nr:hypothetical protein [Colwellia sp.]
MKLTLLELVQDILNDLDSDEVNSISDTTEAIQVAQIVKTAYYEILAGRDWPHLKSVINLDAVGDLTRKTTLKLPEEVTELIWLNYNKIKDGETKRRWLPVDYKYPDEFIRETNQRNSDSDTVEVMTNEDGVEYLIKNNSAPTFWTSFDDEHIVFDSYDSEVDTTTQASKSQAYAYRTPAWSVSDAFIPDLPGEAFSFLLSEAKSIASLKLNQVADEKAEQQSKRQRRRMSTKAFTAKGGIRYFDYGRKGSRGLNNRPRGGND